MATATQPNPPKVTAPYVPFKSFSTALDYLRQGLPHILDRSAWPTFSGGLAGQMLATFRFLGFLNEEYEVTKLLERAVDPDRRKDAVREGMHIGYQELLEGDLSRWTPKQLGDFLGELYNVTGATHKKALTFFLHAAKFIDLPLSPAISRKTRTSGPRRRRVPVVASIDSMPAREVLEDYGAEGGGTPRRKAGSSKTIPLRGGGQATVSFDVDVWSMTPEDQQFVFGLIKIMNEYERASIPPSAEPTSSE